jgi:peptide-methionine (S)-S-oxide reductase
LSAGTSEIVTTTLPSSKSAALATAEATASRSAGPQECPASPVTKPWTKGHAEAIEIIFDPAVVSYRAILERFFQVHDPTTYQQQGSDFGPSYRSAIFYTDEQQKETALATIAEIETSGLWPGPVVTEVNPEERFWQAEPEHQDYLQRHPGGYSCHFIRPSWQLPSARSFPKPRTAEGPQN